MTATPPTQASSVQLIAVDMDGSFLDDQMEYDRARFSALREELRARRIQFVVASGNQYFQLRSFFGEYDDIIYVAENGAYVTDGTRDFYVSPIAAADVTATLAFVSQHPVLRTVLCGKRSAYVLDSQDEGFVRHMRKYYRRLSPVGSYAQIEDTILKFALSCPREDTAPAMHLLRTGLAGVVEPVSSGHGSIDLIRPGVHKANALARLGRTLGIPVTNMWAFGDGGNDVEMLRLVGHGVAMGNAPDHIKAHADAVALSNNDQGVLDYVERHLGAWSSA